MIRTALPILLVLCQFCLQAQIGLEYTIQYQPNQRLLVTMQWETEGASQTIFPVTLLPSGREQINWVSDFKCHSNRMLPIWEPDSTVLSLLHEKGSQAVCSYQIDFQKLSNASIKSAICPMMTNQYFHLMGNFLFLLPETYQSQAIKVKWVGFPEQWQMVNSFGVSKSEQVIGIGDKHWRESVFAGGIMKRYSTQLQQGTLYTIVFGDQFQDQIQYFSRIVAKAIKQETEFWSEKKFQSYTAIFIPLLQENRREEAVTMSGIGLKSAFSAFLQPEALSDTAGLQHLIYHELMHEWIGQRLRMLPTEQMDDERWFIEGFTEFFTLQIEYEAGLISADQFCQIVNKTYFTPLYSAADQRSRRLKSGYFYEKSHFDFYQYQRGLSYAWYLDGRLRCETNDAYTIKDLMLDLMDRAEGSSGEKTDDILLQLLTSKLGNEIVERHHAFTVQRKLIPAGGYRNCHKNWHMNDANGIPQLTVKH